MDAGFYLDMNWHFKVKVYIINVTFNGVLFTLILDGGVESIHPLLFVKTIENRNAW